MIDGLCSSEELARLMYPSAAFAKRAGVEIKVASLTDMPGMSDGTIQALSQAGVKYLFAGFPQYFRWADCVGNKLPMQHGYWNEDIVPWGHPAAFEWESISGGRVLTWYQDGYGWFGDDNEAVVPHDDYTQIESNLSRFIEQLKSRGSPYHIMRYIYHGSDNEAPNMQICDIARRWNEEHTDIQIIVATNTLFFEAMEKEVNGWELPVLRGELPHTDYAVLALSEAAATAQNAKTKAIALCAEKLLTLLGEKKQKNIQDVFNAAILFDEHCFGMEKSYGYENQYNRALKINYSFDAARKTDDLWEIAKSKLKPDDGKYVLFTPFEGQGIFNCFDNGNAFGCTGRTALLRDRHGKDILVQRDEVDCALLPQQQASELYAMRIPGQMLYEYTACATADAMSIQPLKLQQTCEWVVHAKRQPYILENQFYRIEFEKDKCTVKKIVDKAAGSDITDGTPVGQIIGRRLDTNQCIPCIGRSIRRYKQGPVADSMLIFAEGFSTPQIVLEVVLYHATKRIDFNYRILLDQTPLRELFVCFPFQLENPSFYFQGNGARIQAFDDIVPGANTNHYATESYCLVKGDGCQIALASQQSHIVEFGGMHPTAVSHAHHWMNPEGYLKPFIKKEELQNSYIYHMIAYNNCRTNFAAVQQGTVFYSYSITSGADIDADQFANQVCYPPVLLRGASDAVSVKISPESVSPVCLKYSEEGREWILRIRETIGVQTDITICVEGRKLKKTILCTHNERELRMVDNGRITLMPYEIKTLKLQIDEENTSDTVL